MNSLAASLFSLVGVAAAVTITTSEPVLAAIEAAQAAALPESSTSNVSGLAFNRFIQIWLENADYSSAADDPNERWLASKGIKLTNYFAVGHTSEPNYCATASGDTYGMDSDNFYQLPANVSTVANLLNTKGISWAEYEEAIPYPGFQGVNYSNQKTYANDYVRKHNPLIMFDNTTNNDTATRQIKSFTDFYNDIKNQTLPQWAFITPNMTNDGHDTNVSFGSQWLRVFVTDLMSNTYFWNDTLLLLTFDESEKYTVPNRVFSILLGGAIPNTLVGTIDNTMYSHYSSIASVSANWGLPSLGRWDCGANLFQLVANKTGYKNWKVDTSKLLLNESLPGPLAQGGRAQFRPSWPVPATSGSCSGGHGVLEAVISNYEGLTPTFDYMSPFPYDTTAGLEVGVAYSRDETTYVTGVNSTSANTTSASAAHKSAAAKSAWLLRSATLPTILLGVLALKFFV